MKTKQKAESGKLKITPGPAWKAGDWCYHEFELKTIKQMEGDRVTQLSNGYCCSSYTDFTPDIFPVSLRTKLISETFKERRDRLHATGCNELNFPDIARHLEAEWHKAVRLTNDDALRDCYSRLNSFCGGILEAVREVSCRTIFGVKVFRTHLP